MSQLYVSGSGGGGGGSITVTPTTPNVIITGSPVALGGAITIDAMTSSQQINVTGIAFADSPYSVLSTDYYISVDTSGGAITVRLPDAPVKGRIFVVKDSTGNSGANAITVTTVGGVVTIDGAASKTINTNYASNQYVFNGTSYEVY
jgi:hypothetical protein